MGVEPKVLAAGRRGERRDQLLDAAAGLAVERGLGGFTMEGLAARAGVSKALPYRHFSNAEDALVALYRRELGSLAQRIVEATHGLHGDDVLRAAVATYFEALEGRGAVLGVLAGSGSPMPDIAEGGQRRTPQFLAKLVHQAYGVKGRTAMVLASIIAGAVTAGSDSVGRGDASRSTVERLTTTAVIAAAHAVVESQRRSPH